MKKNELSKKEIQAIRARKQFPGSNKMALDMAAQLPSAPDADYLWYWLYELTKVKGVYKQSENGKWTAHTIGHELLEDMYSTHMARAEVGMSCRGCVHAKYCASNAFGFCAFRLQLMAPTNMQYLSEVERNDSKACIPES